MAAAAVRGVTSPRPARPSLAAPPDPFDPGGARGACLHGATPRMSSVGPGRIGSRDDAPDEPKEAESDMTDASPRTFATPRFSARHGGEAAVPAVLPLPPPGLPSVRARGWLG